MKIHISFLMLSVCVLAGCQQYIPIDHYVSVVIDRSEIDSYQPNIDDVMTYLAKAGDSDAITVSLSYISDTQYASKYSFVLGKAQVGWLSNEDKRRKARRKFFKQFKDSLHHYNQRQEPLSRSDIFRVVMREVNEASRQKNTASVLLFSDLKEYSSLFSVYNSGNRQQLLKDANEVAETMIADVELSEDLSGVTLQIIYKPSIEDAHIFTALVSVYRNIIESRGGKVVVGHHTKIEEL